MPSTNYNTQQQQAFSAATSFSKQVGIPVGQAITQMDKFLPELRKGLDDITEADAQIRKVIADVESLFTSMKGWESALLEIVRVLDSRMDDLLSTTERAIRQARTARTYIGAYKNDLESILQGGDRIRRTLARRRFVYQTGTGPQKHTVDSCRNLRMFDNQVTGVTGHLQQIVQEGIAIRRTLDFYGREAGQQRRNQTKQLMTEVKDNINDIIRALTTFMRSDYIGLIRRYIDRTNGDNCGRPGGRVYIGPTRFPPTPAGRRDRARAYQNPANWRDATAQDNARDCHGLNKFSDLMQRTARKQGRTWTQYRQRWNRLSNTDKERNITTAFKRLRKVLENMRDRDIPAERKKFVDAFRGMAQVLGRSGPGAGLTQSDINGFGPIPKAYLNLNAALGQAIRLRAQAAQLEPMMTAFSNPANVSCESGSNYAGIFGGDEGEPLSPMMVVGGGFAAGVAVAYFFPNLWKL